MDEDEVVDELEVEDDCLTGVSTPMRARKWASSGSNLSGPAKGASQLVLREAMASFLTAVHLLAPIRRPADNFDALTIFRSKLPANLSVGVLDKAKRVFAVQARG